MRVNGKQVCETIKDNMTLVAFLRDTLRLTGTKKGCGVGECGACTVLVDGLAVDSCLLLAAQVDGKSVTTIEGLGSINQLDPIQEAFVETGGVQCGYCTPGMVMSAKAMLEKNNKPSRDEIKKALSGNLCRCTGYTKIVQAVELAAEKMVQDE